MRYIQQFHVEVDGKYRCPFRETISSVPWHAWCKECGAYIWEHRPEPFPAERKAFDRVKCEKCGKLVREGFKVFMNLGYNPPRNEVLCEEC
jgi:hypothetical protein